METPSMDRGSNAAARTASITADENGIIVELNQTAEEIFGLPRATALGASIEMIIPPELQHAALTGVARVATGGHPRMLDQPREFEAMRTDGSRLPIELLVTRTGTEPPRFTAWIRDLDAAAPETPESRRRELLAARAEQAVHLGSWELDIATGAQEWSENLYRLLGYEVGEVEPSEQAILERVHEDDFKRVAMLWERLSAKGELAPLEYRVVWPNGEVRHLRTTLSMLERDRDGATGAIGSVQDITDRRRAEREVEAHVAVTEALSDWTSLAERGPKLLEELGRAFDAAVGVIWIPQGDVLVCHALWPSARLGSREFVEATQLARLPRGSGLPGRAWDRCEPVSLTSAGDYDFDRGRVANEAGLDTGVAFPAIVDGEAIIVVEILARERFELTESLNLSLTAIGHQLGQFLARHRGELAPQQLTPRELELLALAADGLSGPAIAERLTISPATVKTHFENIYAKLGVPDRVSAVAEVLRLGLFE